MIIFFKKELVDVINSGKDKKELVISSEYQYRIFIPSLFKPIPQGIRYNPIFYLWALFYSFIWKFQKKNYELHLLYHNQTLVHYSVVLPKNYRFPFMNSQDIEIGPCWTHQDHRGQHLYSYVLNKIVNRFKNKKVSVWMICDTENVLSQKGILRTGFKIVGYGRRTKILGLRLLGKYKLEKLKEG